MPPAWTSTTFTLRADKNTLVFVDVNSTVGFIGDNVFYWANFTVNGASAPVGYVIGQRTNMITPSAAQAFTGIAGIVVEEVVSYYRFFSGEQIIIGGSMELPASQFAPGLASNELKQRPIFGGTGRWKGATGTDYVTRDPDGTYAHRIEVLLPNPAAVQRVPY